MTEQSVVTDAMRRAVGVERASRRRTWSRRARSGSSPTLSATRVPRTAARRTAEPSPPPTFLRSLDAGPATAVFESPYPDLLDGGSEWEYARPVRAGDRITVTQTLVDVAEKSGRLGPMLLTTCWQTRYVDDGGATVATQRNTLVYYRAERDRT